jgi:cytochrome c oxidase subunit II
MRPSPKVRNLLVVCLLLAGALGVGVVFADAPASQAQEQNIQVIKINARKFEFLPAAITLKQGVPVILELTSSDVVMGFNVPDMKSRVTILPGVVTRIRLVPDKVGVFTFLCDIFCGDGHEDMNGTITVVS